MSYSDFHMHTKFADGRNTPEEMILSAIDMGLSTVGISEHAMLPFPTPVDMSYDLTLAYRAEMARLKEKYAGKIEVLNGIEMGYDSNDDPSAYDYVIGSVHYLIVNGEVYGVGSIEDTRICLKEAFGGDLDSYAEAYYEKLSGVVEKVDANIIGHLDLISKFEKAGLAPAPTSSRYISAWKCAMRELVGKATLEINTGGISRGHKTDPYPMPEMLKEWKRLGGTVVLSSDSHAADTINYKFDEALALAKDCGFTTGGFTDKRGKKHIQF